MNGIDIVHQARDNKTKQLNILRVKTEYPGVRMGLPTQDIVIDKD